MSELFEQLKSQHEGVLDASIVSAFALNGGQLRQLIVMLEKRFKREINAKVRLQKFAGHLLGKLLKSDASYL